MDRLFLSVYQNELETLIYIIYNAQQNFLYLFLGNTPSLILSCQTNRTLLVVHNVCCQCPSHKLLICFFCIGSKLFCLKSNNTVSLLGVTYFQKMLNCLVNDFTGEVLL